LVFSRWLEDAARMTDRGDDARRAAVEAAARGWITTTEVWEAALRFAAGLRTSDALFRELLNEDQLRSLGSGTSSEETLPHIPSDAMPRVGGANGGAFARSSSAPSSVRATPSAPPSIDPAAMPGHLTGARYRGSDPLGAGGVGSVVATRDREIGRLVALKTIRERLSGDSRLVRKFLLEARVTSQLEHPNIVPVYDLGTLPDGRPFYTMRIVKKHSLADVLGLAASERWSLVRLLGVFVQMCRALAFAHDRGVLHGDIKPENILLGDFGEVYIADWGLVRVQPQSEVRVSRSSFPPPSSVAPEEEPVPLELPGLDGAQSDYSPPGGTPGYVAPEVATGDWTKVDHRADLFSLGVVLYEILVGQRPFQGKDARATLIATITRKPRPPREIDPRCPLLLEDLCLRLLSRDKERRPQSAGEVVRWIEEFLEGAKEKERRREEALRLCSLANKPAEEHQALEEESTRLVAQARDMLKGIEDWQPVAVKRPSWDVEERAAAAEREAARKLAEAIDLYTQALGYDAECREAHEGLADLYWSRARAAERERRRALQIYYEALVMDHDTGCYAELLSAMATLSVRSDPPGAQVLVARYDERDRVLVPSEARPVGRTPREHIELEPGSYLVILRLPGYREARYPVLLRRGSRHQADVSLYTEAEVGEGFVHVPGGPFIMGGDPEAIDALPRQEVVVPDFAIARFPITMREYCAYLDALERDDPAEAERRAPHNLKETYAASVKRGENGRWEPHDLVIEGEAREKYPPEDGHFWNVPIHLVHWFGARAYCQWRSDELGTTIRLPSEAEWEKAARGVDGRFFPWGDRFDATFCLMRHSRSWLQQPEPIGTFPTDESPYGVRDVAGGMREWMADIHGERTAEELLAAPEPAEGAERAAVGARVSRSGAWNSAREFCRCASRSRMHALMHGTVTTFRVVKSLPERRR
jgi:eukaryotic-like serine/threonine-protein kinase